MFLLIIVICSNEFDSRCNRCILMFSKNHLNRKINHIHMFIIINILLGNSKGCKITFGKYLTNTFCNKA